MQLSAGFKNLMIGFIPFALAGLDHVPIVILTIFLFIDTITGVIASVRVKGWIAFNSRRLTFGILFKFLTLLIPLILVWTGKGVGLDLLFLAIWSVNVLIVSEALSIIGNISTIKTGEFVEEVDAVNLILNKARRFLSSFLEREESKKTS